MSRVALVLLVLVVIAAGSFGFSIGRHGRKPAKCYTNSAFPGGIRLMTKVKGDNVEVSWAHAASAGGTYTGWVNMTERQMSECEPLPLETTAVESTTTAVESISRLCEDRPNGETWCLEPTP
jgi:hypothetical protein